MLFQEKKLTLEDAQELVPCPVDKVKPYSLMFTPVYVYMKMNRKFVAVKAPLDFFGPDELQRMATYHNLFFPKYAHQAVRFQTAARLAKSLLTTEVQQGLIPTAFEYSKEIESILLPLWGRDLKVEPFFMAVFVDEFCPKIPAKLMENAREKTVQRHDLGLLLSGAYVFIALQTGNFRYEALKKMREEIYVRTTEGDDWNQGHSTEERFISELLHLVQNNRSFDLKSLGQESAEWSRRLVSRLRKFQAAKLLSKEASPSIYGEGGFVA